MPLSGKLSKYPWVLKNFQNCPGYLCFPLPRVFTLAIPFVTRSSRFSPFYQPVNQLPIFLCFSFSKTLLSSASSSAPFPLPRVRLFPPFPSACSSFSRSSFCFLRRDSALHDLTLFLFDFDKKTRNPTFLCFDFVDGLGSEIWSSFDSQVFRFPLYPPIGILAIGILAFPADLASVSHTYSGNHCDSTRCSDFLGQGLPLSGGDDGLLTGYSIHIAGAVTTAENGNPNRQ